MLSRHTVISAFSVAFLFVSMAMVAPASASRYSDLMSTDPTAGGGIAQHVQTSDIAGREAVIYVPSSLPPEGSRSMVVALHGGGGNAHFMQSRLKMDGLAEKQGFVVAYLNGTSAAKILAKAMLAWNAGGGCCGLPATNQVDDVGYITKAVAELTRAYGIDPSRVYVMGHSNGSIMGQLMLCTTNVFQAGVTISGPVNVAQTSCPAARGKRILAIHGIEDLNVPIGGGVGTKGPESARKLNYRAEASAKAMFEQSGASYTLDALKNTDHGLEHIAATIQETEGMTLAEKAAKFFGLER